MSEISIPQITKQPLKRGIERAGFPETKERLVRTLGNLVGFQTIADGQHQDQMRGLFDYVGEKVDKVQQETGRKFVKREWNNDGHLSTIITPVNPSRPDEEALLHPKIALLIHADVVNAEDQGMFEMKRTEDTLYGRGVYDMKQGLAIGLDLLTDLPVGAALIVTSDEEVGGEHGAKFLAQEIGIKPEFLIILDGQKSEHVSFGSKGYWHSKISFNSLLGLGGHGSRYEDYSANELEMDLRNSLREHYPWRYSNSPAGTTYSIGKIEGGNATNKVSQYAECRVDMRFPNDEERKQGKNYVYAGVERVILERLQDVYGEKLPVQLETKVEIVDGKEIYKVAVVNPAATQRYEVAEIATTDEGSVYAIDPQNPHVQKFMQVLEVITGQSTLTNDKDTGAHDGVNWPHIPAIVYMPKGGNAHKSTEWVSAESLTQTREAIGQFLQEEL